MTVTKQVEMQYYKTTKHTVVYKSEDAQAVCKSVYLEKAVLPLMPPKSIRVDVSFTD